MRNAQLSTARVGVSPRDSPAAYGIPTAPTAAMSAPRAEVGIKLPGLLCLLSASRPPGHTGCLDGHLESDAHHPEPHRESPLGYIPPTEPTPSANDSNGTYTGDPSSPQSHPTRNHKRSRSLARPRWSRKYLALVDTEAPRSARNRWAARFAPRRPIQGGIAAMSETSDLRSGA